MFPRTGQSPRHSLNVRTQRCISIWLAQAYYLLLNGAGCEIVSLRGADYHALA
jgi:hypothetical protein